MCTLDIIKALLKSERKTQQELCQYLGVSKQAFTEWNGGRNTSYKKYLPQIAEFFGVSVDYLLGKTDQKEKPAEDGGLGENIVRFLGRDGKVLEKKLTPELLAYLESIPDSDDKL